MNTYRNISGELKAYFSNHKILGILLPLDMILIFGGIGIMVLSRIISLGGLLNAIAYYGFLLGLLLAYANFNQRYLYTGFFAYAALDALDFIRYAIFNTYRFVDFYSLVSILVFAGIGYLIFKNESINKGTNRSV